MLGQMNKKAIIVSLVTTKDSEGFSSETEVIVASIRCSVEERHGSEKWANLSVFSEATNQFKFRRIPGTEVTPEMYIIYEGDRYDILSVEGTHGRGMYLEVLAKRNEASHGKV